MKKATYMIKSWSRKGSFHFIKGRSGLKFVVSRSTNLMLVSFLCILSPVQNNVIIKKKNRHDFEVHFNMSNIANVMVMRKVYKISFTVGWRKRPIIFGLQQKNPQNRKCLFILTCKIIWYLRNQIDTSIA